MSRKKPSKGRNKRSADLKLVHSDAKRHTKSAAVPPRRKAELGVLNPRKNSKESLHYPIISFPVSEPTNTLPVIVGERATGERITVGARNAPLLLICGPCQIESVEHAVFCAEHIIQELDGLPLSLIYKSSYDKANRTSLSGKRGIGLDKGLRALEEVRRQFNIPVLTDVHSVEQAQAAASVVDILQTPAFLCRQTDFLIGVGETGKPINVKKGQFLAPQDMALVAEKISSTGNRKIMLCERGSCFGYRDLVVDMRSLEIMRRTGYPVIFDATHSTQSMGGAGGSSGGSREFVAPLARAAVACGVDGIFMEAHNNPDTAPSDGPSMVPFARLRETVEPLVRIREALIR